MSFKISNPNHSVILIAGRARGRGQRRLTRLLAGPAPESPWPRPPPPWQRGCGGGAAGAGTRGGRGRAVAGGASGAGGAVRGASFPSLDCHSYRVRLSLLVPLSLLCPPFPALSAFPTVPTFPVSTADPPVPAFPPGAAMPGPACGSPLDYKTAKFSLTRNRRVGLLHRLLQLGALGYLLG